MQQLSGTDHVMLIGERRNVYNHVASLVIYDVTTAPGGKVRFKDILQHFDQRLYLHPVFRRRLVTVPFGVDRPYWVTETRTSTSSTTSGTLRCRSPATGGS